MGGARGAGRTHKSTVARFCVGARAGPGGEGPGAAGLGAAGPGLAGGSGRAWNLPGSDASADSAASACGMRRMILPDVMRRPKPSWCAKAYPERTERRARRADGVRGAGAAARQRWRARSRSASVGRVQEHARRHDTTGTIRMIMVRTAVNQKVACVSATVSEPTYGPPIA